MTLMAFRRKVLPPVTLLDTTAPVVSGLATSGVTASGVTVTFTTNEAATSEVQYATDAGFTSPTTVTASASPATSHSKALSGLSASTTYYVRARATDAASNTSAWTSGVSFATSGSGLGADAMVVDSVTATPNKRGIGLEILYHGDAAKVATVGLQFRKQGVTPWRVGWQYDGALWRTVSGIGSAGIYGSIVECDPGTVYEVKLIFAPGADGVDLSAVGGTNPYTFFVTTDGDTLANPYDASGHLTATMDHWISPTGSDGAAGTLAAPWRTLSKAVSGSTAGQKIGVKAGHYQRYASQITKTLEFYGEYAPVTWNPALGRSGEPEEINTANRVVVYQDLIGPTGATENLTTDATPGPLLAKGGWLSVTPDGNGAHVLWRLPKPWATTQTIMEMGYADTLGGALSKVHHWNADASQLATASGFATVVYTNQTYNYGFWQDGATSDLYARFPAGVDPNTKYVYIGGNNSDRYAFDVWAPNCRFAGVTVRVMDAGWRAYAGGSGGNTCTFEKFIVEGCRYGVQFRGVDTGTVVGTGGLVQDFIIRDSNVWATSGTHAGDPLVAPWNFVKSGITLANGTEYGNKIGEVSEGVAINGKLGHAAKTIRRGLIQQMFNGISEGNSTFDNQTRYGGHDTEIYQVTFRQIPDDCLEPEGASINWRAWDCHADHVKTFVSNGPLTYGPMYWWRCTGYHIGSDGAILAPLTFTGTKPGGGSAIKYGGTSAASGAPGLLMAAHLTMHCDGLTEKNEGVQFSTAGAGGGPWVNDLRNSIIVTNDRTIIIDDATNRARWRDVTNQMAGTTGTSYGSTMTTDTAYQAAYHTQTGKDTTTNVVGSSHTDTATIKGWFTNLAGGDVTLDPTNGAAALNVGTPIGNISDIGPADAAANGVSANYQGAAPDLGFREVS